MCTFREPPRTPPSVLQLWMYLFFHSVLIVCRKVEDIKLPRLCDTNTTPELEFRVYVSSIRPCSLGENGYKTL